MKYIEINRKYSEVVSSYLVNGYVINTSTMDGSQGDRAHIDLTNGSEIVRILVRDVRNQSTFTYDVEIIVGKCADKRIAPNSSTQYGTIWNNELEVISAIRYRQISVDRYDEKEYEAAIDQCADQN